ncbi:hypothetical protein C2G38_2136149 [Gigaspora rosea]|uniref:Uncharacterized protein n=1 Tax=Gigaspora rosea TaxID=44941 RepID=A0A397W852_9GLOM|nr:hypothetical protein C2G38_2136149 [Gigaspora rosea]
MSTIDGGYAIINANCSPQDANSNRILAVRCVLSADFISYNEISQDRTAILYQINHQNITFNGVYCDLVSAGVGQVCTISVSYPITVNNSIVNNNSTVNNSTIPANNTANNTMSTTEYIKVNFLSSGSVLQSNVIKDLPNVPGIPSVGWRAKAMSYGGYILDATDVSNPSNIVHYIFAYDEFNLQTTLDPPSTNFSTNAFGANNIMNNNNTFLLASRLTNDQNTSWTLKTIPLPKVAAFRDHGYSNLLINKITPPINAAVDSSTTTLNIVFFDPVVLADSSIGLSIGNITIRKTSDNSIRQQITPKMTNFCKVSPDGKTLNITVISSTFNQRGENYFVQMDNNFVMSRFYSEPIKGIDYGVWNLSSTYQGNSSAGAILGIVALSTEASKKFLSLHDRSEYFKTLLDEIANKTPVRRDRLSTNKKFQYINYGLPNAQIIFSIRVSSPNSNDENTVLGVLSDINTMILYKQVTTFSTGYFTNDLDQYYGFQINKSLSDSSSAEITVAVPVLIAIIILYFISYDNIKYFDKLFKLLGLESEDQRKTIMQMIHTFSGYAIIVINLLLTVYFVFISTKDKPELIWPSVIIWGVPIIINLIIVIILVIHAFRPSNIDMEAMDREVSKELNEMINKLFEKLHNKIKKIIEDVSCDISKKINEICSNIKDISHKIHDKIDGEKIHEIISNISNDYRRISHIMPKISNSGISASKDSESINAQLTPDMQEAIIAKVRDEVLIVLLDKLFELLQDEFFKLLDGNICEYLEKEMNEILSNKAINKGGVLDAIIDENDEESSGTKDVRNVKNELQPNEVVGKLLGKISKQTKKEIIGKILEKISSQLKKTFSFKIKGKIRSKTCLPEFAKLLKQIGNISDVLKNVSNEADEDKFYEEMQHMIHKLSDEIQHKLNELVTKFSEKMKEVLNDTVKEISTKVQNQIAGEMKKEDSNQEKGSQKNEQVKIEEAPQKSLTDTFKSLLKHDEEAANTAKSMFILFVIVDSESFLILDNATKNNISSETHKRRAHNRSLLGMVKSFSIIIIMSIYAATVVIYSLIPFLALLTSCFKFLVCSIILYSIHRERLHRLYSKKNKNPTIVATPEKQIA